MNIGNVISILRKNKGLKQKELAFLSGVSNNAMCSIESSKYIPKIETLQSISKSLGVNYGYITLLTIEDLKVDSDLEVEFEVYFKKLKKIIEQSNI